MAYTTRNCTFHGNWLAGSLGVYFVSSEDTSVATGNLSIELRAFLRTRDKNKLFITDLSKPTKLDLKPAIAKMTSG